MQVKEEKINKDKFARSFRSPIPILLALVAVVFCIPLVVKDPSWLQLAILTMWYAYLTCSWNLVGGFAGQLSLGHAAFIGIGAYTSTALYLHFGLSPWIGMFVGGAFAVVAAITVFYPCLRLLGAYFALASIGFAELIKILTENTTKIFGIEIRGPRGLSIPPLGHAPFHYQFVNKAYYYYTILIMLLIAWFITYRISKTKLGYCLSAIRNDVEAAQSLGVNISKCRLMAVSLSAFLSAIGGTFYAQLLLYIYPEAVMGIMLSCELAFIALIGGRGTVMGPIIGALIYVPASELSRIYLSGGRFLGVHLMLLGIVVMAVMLFQPGGLMRPIARVYTRWVKKLEPQVQKV